MSETADVVIVGGGVIGLATARSLLRAAPTTSVVVLEREPSWGAHQSGHNSNVIHSGLYYRPGSLKAKYARAGGEAMVRYCRERGVPVRRTGKIVVATTPAEVRRLGPLAERGRANGVTVRPMNRTEIAEREPHVAGLAALYVEDTAVTDFRLVCEALANEIADLGADLRLNSGVVAIAAREGVRVHTERAEYSARMLINCAGLHSDKVAEMAGARPPVRIVPFRGEYAELRPDRRHLITNPVYPVPDPALPFLGVHLTPMLDGAVHVGPNAVLALSRNGYRWRDVDPGLLRELARDPALRGLARRYWRSGLTEMARSLVWPLFVRDVRGMVPELTAEDLRKCGSGVRAQAVSPDGELVDDFVLTESPHAVHVLNAPSPAATSSLLIGDRIAGTVLDQLGLPGQDASGRTAGSGPPA